VKTSLKKDNYTTVTAMKLPKKDLWLLKKTIKRI